MTEPETIAALKWGIEDTGDHLWIGPMRCDGKKVNEIVADYDLRDLTPEAEKRYRQLAGIIVNAVNQTLDQPAPESNKCAECERLEKVILDVQDAIKIAGGRWCEWGGRAESVRDALLAALAQHSKLR